MRRIDRDRAEHHPVAFAVGEDRWREGDLADDRAIRFRH
jgi:hypothetical protein